MKVSALFTALLAFSIAQPLWAAGGFKDAVTGMEFVPVPAGCFQMGDGFGDGAANERPLHQVCVAGFNIGKYEVTQGEWKKIMGSNPSRFSGCGDGCPVENVGREDAQEFIRRLNRKSDRRYRLPSEAEWEYAARSGGRREKFSGGDDVDAVSWYSGNAGGASHAVGQKRPNGLGIFDMSGNVLEPVLSNVEEGGVHDEERLRPELQEPFPILRGGCWYDGQRGVRASDRGNYAPAGQASGCLGLRLVSSPD